MRIDAYSVLCTLCAPNFSRSFNFFTLNLFHKVSGDPKKVGRHFVRADIMLGVKQWFCKVKFLFLFSLKISLVKNQKTLGVLWD